ncbi:hypothetical protein ENKNEFLB_00544 [Nocardioides aquaticus]|uniref:Adenylate/guanylate cyclase domain-containing protein n=2 Tax=Nocardioides aquaticus TaxID=160826 RepID=A0ABX8ECJ9_9ACTN|nr:hypothetical protein ENKNEFLB_00544 [Nocardioides aquaticus]
MGNTAVRLRPAPVGRYPAAMPTSPQGVGSTAFESVLLGPTDQSPRRLRWRVQVLLTSMLLATHLIGAAVVVVLSVLVLPSTPLSDASVVGLAIAVPVYVVVAVVVGGTAATVRGLRALRWSSQGRAPSEQERRTALRLPWQLTLVQAAMWAGALGVFSLLSLLLQPERALTTALTIAIAGLVVSAVAFLLSEFGLRPIAARALTGELLQDGRGLVGVRRRMVVFWLIGTAAPLMGVFLAAVIFLADGALGGEDLGPTRFAWIVLALAGVVLGVGLLVTLLTTRAVVGPITSVRQALLRVGEGDLDTEITVYDGTELGLLQAGFNQMVRGLREREELRDVFGRHVGREVADAAAAGSVELGGQSRAVTVLFVDLVGSTSFATERDADEVVGTLNRFFAVVVEEVGRERGLVNKFMGDAVLAVFGAPVDHEDHPGAGLRAGRRIAARLAEEVGEIRAGIGIATGTAFAGNVGDEQRYEYTVIGDSVNCAARLCDLAKDPPPGTAEAVGSSLLLAAMSTVAAAAGDEAGHWRAAGSTVLRGRSEETELAALAAPVSAAR